MRFPRISKLAVICKLVLCRRRARHDLFPLSVQDLHYQLLEKDQAKGCVGTAMDDLDSVTTINNDDPLLD
jgi:hypothetical protein